MEKKRNNKILYAHRRFSCMNQAHPFEFSRIFNATKHDTQTNKQGNPMPFSFRAVFYWQQIYVALLLLFISLSFAYTHSRAFPMPTIWTWPNEVDVNLCVYVLTAFWLTGRTNAVRWFVCVCVMAEQYRKLRTCHSVIVFSELVCAMRMPENPTAAISAATTAAASTTCWIIIDPTPLCHASLRCGFATCTRTHRIRTDFNPGFYSVFSVVHLAGFVAGMRLLLFTFRSFDSFFATWRILLGIFGINLFTMMRNARKKWKISIIASMLFQEWHEFLPTWIQNIYDKTFKIALAVQWSQY